MAERRPKGDGSYRQLPNGRWEFRLTVGRKPNGKPDRRKAHGRTRSEARSRLLKKEAERQAGRTQASVGDLIDRHLHHLEVNGHLLDKTVAQYRAVLDAHVRPALGGAVAGAVSVQDVDGLWQAMAAAGSGRDLIEKVRRQLNAAFKMALSRREISWNPVELSSIPRVAVKGQQARRSLSAEEVEAFLVAARGHRLEHLIVVLLTTGMRPAEAYALTWGQIDWDEGTLRVDRALKSSSGRPVGQPKTQAGVREIVMSEVTYKALQAQQQQVQLERQVRWPAQWSGLVFPSEQGTPLEDANVRRVFRKVSADAGLEAPLRPYECRHTATSLLADLGVPNEELADLLGHSSTRTLTHYRFRLRPASAGRSLDGHLTWEADPDLGIVDELGA